MNNDIKYEVVSISKNGLGKWGRYAHAAELRIRDINDNRPLKGRGCHDGLIACYKVDTRYHGPKSYFGKLLRQWGIV